MIIGSAPFQAPIHRPTAATLTQGINGGNVWKEAQHLAQDSATITGSLEAPLQAQLTRDVGDLKTRLWSRLSDRHMQTALMTAGSLLAGPGGATVQGLATTLRETLGSQDAINALARRMEEFHSPKSGVTDQADLAYHSLNTGVRRELLGDGITGHDVPLSMFIAGSLLSRS